MTVHEFVLQAQVPSPEPSEKSKSCPPWQLLVAETDANQPTYTNTAMTSVRQSPRDFKIEREVVVFDETVGFVVAVTGEILP